MKYYVIETAGFPNAFKVTYDFANTKDMGDNTGCNYFSSFDAAQTEANKRNQHQVISSTFIRGRGSISNSIITRRNGGRGSISNSIITRRNGGVVHQFIDDIGGCSANYR